MENGKIKTSCYIINKLTKHYKPLNALFQYKEFLSLLSANHRQMISKIFVKNNTLIILAKHHVAYMELNHDDTKKTIKNLIKHYTFAKAQSIFANINNIKILSDRNFIHQNQTNINPKKHFIELSNAKFSNNITNPILHKQFEQLREIIKNARK
ncbi:hypothetical protein [Campylobacter volucris]|uniref:hypothetical protein n=1 Tax=Campylobacter volucris TaxID=1031542 RepID=UPI00057DE73C|nr:hypothetical protein [Campylobacter volucris]AJC93902.1 hypothetical protein CVOL_0584 [Campylobacter volucris LMG 24379]MBF7043988.1 hypothetical protein [Campylobacter volucris]QEL08115.1 hypothetical protein CVOLT_0585 [Campylobacter volucris]